MISVFETARERWWSSILSKYSFEMDSISGQELSVMHFQNGMASRSGKMKFSKIYFYKKLFVNKKVKSK